ncbi:MAG: glycosyltransferase [Lachnospiraceae bacterium]|nr:glycosyltransferase [Lachnospiraceae bacterium]
MTSDFSVLMSVYDKEKPEWFRAALDSVLSQSCQPGEILIMQDGPLTAELDAVLDEYQAKYPCIRTIRLKEHVYLGRALAAGVEACRYELIARMDTDDLATPDRFALQTAYMQKHPEIHAVGGYMEEFFDGSDFRQIKTMPTEPDKVLKFARYRNPLNHMTVMFRRSAVLEAGNYRHFPFLEDYDLWARMLGKGFVLANIPEVLVEARTSEALYKRRGGWSYFKRYVTHRGNQRREGLLSEKEYVISLILCCGMTLQPAWLRKLAYRKLLRK